MIIELGHSTPGGKRESMESFGGRSSSFSGLRAMVCESVGPVRHEVSVPFHDSQVRGIALLIQTGWDQRWDSASYWEPGPFLADHLIFRMVRAGVKLVGVDFSVSGEQSKETRLITGDKIAIVENLRNLASVPRVGFRFTVEPLESATGTVYSVRAFAEL